ESDESAQGMVRVAARTASGAVVDSGRDDSDGRRGEAAAGASGAAWADGDGVHLQGALSRAGRNDGKGGLARPPVQNDDMILTEQQTMIRDMARQFAREELAPHAAERDAKAEFPRQAVEAMAALGLMGMLVPEEWGGAGVDRVSYALAVEELAAGDGSCSTI